MKALLIDYKRIISKAPILKSKLVGAPTSHRGFLPATILVVESSAEEKLTEIQPGNKRVEYINSADFVESIEDYFYGMYNAKKGIFVMETACEKYLPIILSSIFSSLPPETLLWTGLEIEESDFTSKIDTFISNGFNSPYISTISPMYSDIKPSVALTRKNIPTDPDMSTATLNKVLYAVQQYEKGEKGCYLHAQLTPRAIGFLRECPDRLGYVVDDKGENSQRELTGELYVRDVRQENDEFVYMIDIDKSSVESGDEENVDVAGTRYNFHSHPREAYVRHTVEKAWPSVTDYLGYHNLGANTIFHCVASLEGVYVISFSPEWGLNIGKVDRAFIEKNFNVDHKSEHTPEEYTDFVNQIKYKGRQIFRVIYFPWDSAGNVFRVFFPQTGSACVPSEQIMEKYKKVFR